MRARRLLPALLVALVLSPAAVPAQQAKPRARLEGVPAGSVVAVKALNARGLEGWDWARAVAR